MSNSIYIYMFRGDFSVKTRDYFIEIPMPTKHKTIESAKNDKSSARFEKRNGHVVIVIYSNWEQGIKNGKWYEHVSGSELEIIHWENWYRYQIAQDNGKEQVGLIDPCTDYLPFSQNWDELFDVNNLSDDWSCTIENLAYSILTYVK